MACYAALNAYADVRNGNHGFANTWRLARFETRAARDSWVAKYENKDARAVTRREAESMFRANYHCTGKPVPVGGLFGPDKRGEAIDTNFDNWNADE